VQFPKAQSIHRGFSYRDMKDDDKKSSLRNWEPITEFFIAPCQSWYDVKEKPQRELCAPL
jgi:hypothetical protein